jgi:hypothetical protein
MGGGECVKIWRFVDVLVKGLVFRLFKVQILENFDWGWACAGAVLA